MRSLSCAQQRDYSNAAPCERLIGQDGLDFIDHGFRLTGVYVTLAGTTLHEHVNQWWVQPFIRLGYAQRLDVTLIELAVGKLDDGRHAPEMLLEHHRISCEHNASQVVNGLVRRHFRAKRLVGKEPIAEVLDSFFRHSNR